MLNERKLTKAELNKREDIIMKMKKNKRELVKRYGKDAEKVMYGRATQLAKKQAEAMDNEKIREMVKTALQGPVSEKKGKDMDGDGDIDSQDYLAARDAAIKKAKGEKVDEMDINDPVLMKMRAANAGNDGNDKFFAKNAIRLKKLKALKDKRAEIMRDMEQEAELEGGPIADRYGDMLNKIDKAIGMLSEDNLNEGFYGSSDVESITNALGYADVYDFFEDNPGAVSAILDWAENVPEFNEMLQDADLLQEDLDLGHEDNEPHMLKADLYRIGKYAMELYQMVDKFEASSEEVDFPHWWQSKVIKAKDMLVSAKHYLDFEIKEPQIDAMVDVAQDTEAIDEAVGKFVVRPCSNPGTPFAVWQTSKDGENDKRIKGFKTKEDAKKFADEKNSLDENAIGINDRRLDDKQKSALDLAVRGDSSYTFGNDPYADDQLRYKYAKKMGFLEEKKEIKEGTWAVGNAKDIQRIVDMLNKLKDNAYNVVGDDDFFNGLDNAISRAEELMMNAPLSEDEVGETDKLASDIQKAMNKHKKDDAKMYQLQQARTAMNKGDLEKAKKIAARLAEKLKSN